MKVLNISHCCLANRLKNTNKFKNHKDSSLHDTCTDIFMISLCYVSDAPRFTAGAEHVPADVGDDAILNCAVDGNPTPTIIWSRKDSPTILGSQKYLKLYGVTEKDFGIYVCKASILGFNEIEMHVHLLKKGE